MPALSALLVAIVSLAIPHTAEENFQPLFEMHRKFRDEQHMIIFVLLARPKWRNVPILQRWCIPKHVD